MQSFACHTASSGLVLFFSFLFHKWRLLCWARTRLCPCRRYSPPGSCTMKTAHWISSFMGFAEAGGAHPIGIAADSAYLGEFRSHSPGCRHSSLSPRPCQNHEPWVDGFPHPVRSPGEIAVARYAKELSAKNCVSPLSAACRKKLLHLPGRSQGGRDSKSPPSVMARGPLRSFLKQSGNRYV